MNVSAIPKDNGNAIASSSAPKNKQQELGQEDFMKLMMAQFQNQDPFKPMENGEFLGQMAQFSTVNGLDALNAKFESLAGALGSNQAVGAAQLIGHDALFQTSSFSLSDPEAGMDAALERGYGGTVTVEIADASGQLIRRMGVDASSDNKIHWDGITDGGKQVAAGLYQIRAFTSVGGTATEVPVLVAGRITGVSMGGSQGATLNVAGLGERQLADVREISEI